MSDDTEMPLNIFWGRKKIGIICLRQPNCQYSATQWHISNCSRSYGLSFARRWSRLKELCKMEGADYVVTPRIGTRSRLQGFDLECMNYWMFGTMVKVEVVIDNTVCMDSGAFRAKKTRDTTGSTLAWMVASWKVFVEGFATRGAMSQEVDNDIEARVAKFGQASGGTVAGAASSSSRTSSTPQGAGSGGGSSGVSRLSAGTVSHTGTPPRGSSSAGKHSP